MASCGRPGKILHHRGTEAQRKIKTWVKHKNDSSAKTPFFLIKTS
jgi:hypothetical protein